MGSECLLWREALEGQRWGVKRCLCWQESTQTEAGHVPVCPGQLRGAAACPPALPTPAVLARQGAVAGGVPGVGLSAGGEQGRTR